MVAIGLAWLGLTVLLGLHVQALWHGGSFSVFNAKLGRQVQGVLALFFFAAQVFVWALLGRLLWRLKALLKST